MRDWLKSFSNGVFCSDTKLVSTDKAGAGNMIYFPFVASSSAVGTLRIYDESGLRYSETTTALTANTHYVFRFDFLNAPTAADTTGATGSWINGKGLGAGTYRYSITVGTTEVSSGNFTLIAE